MSDGFIQRGGIWVLVQFTILFAVFTLGLTFPGATRHLPTFLCGVALLAASGICGILGTVALGRNLTPFPTPRSQTNLVQHGIYGFMRHPLYTAVICAALGWSLIRASWPALVGSVVLALFLDAKARREEAWLCREFPEYTPYRKRVRKFLPCFY